MEQLAGGNCIRAINCGKLGELGIIRALNFLAFGHGSLDGYQQPC